MKLPTSSNTSHMQPVLLSSSTRFKQTCKQEFTHAALDKYPAKTRMAVHVAKGTYKKHNELQMSCAKKKEKRKEGDIIEDGKRLVCSFIWSITPGLQELWSILLRLK